MQQRVYYTQLESPWGPLFLAGGERGICTCQFKDGKDLSSLFARLQQQRGKALLQEGGAPLGAAVEALKRYFSGELVPFRHPLDLRGTPFQMQVWSMLREIPPGRVVTYGEIAARLGRPGGARAVGQACGKNPVVLLIPCHRVVAAHGKLGGFSSGLNLKEALLQHEGAELHSGRSIMDAGS